MHHTLVEKIRGRIRLGVFWLGTAFEFSLGVIGVLVGHLLGLRLDDFIYFEPVDVHLGLLGVSPVAALFLVTLYSDIGPLRRIRRFMEQAIVPLFAAVPLWGLFLLSLGAGLGEELLFRFGIQQGLSVSLGPVGAWLVSSVLFGLAHAVTPAYVVLATLMGLYLGGVFYITENLVTPILIHAVYDFIALVWLLRFHSPGTAKTDGAGGDN